MGGRKYSPACTRGASGLIGHAAGNRADQVAHQSDGHFAAFNIIFHQRGLFVFVDDKTDLLAQFIFGIDHRFGADAHAGAFAAGFDKQGKFQVIV